MLVFSRWTEEGGGSGLHGEKGLGERVSSRESCIPPGNSVRVVEVFVIGSCGQSRTCWIGYPLSRDSPIGQMARYFPIGGF